MTFDGETFDPARDGPRLRGQLRRVHAAMSDGGWWWLSDLAQRTASSEASVSARLRDLRKPRFGGYFIDRRYVAGGVWEYRMRPTVPRTIGSNPNLVFDPLAESMIPIRGWTAKDQKPPQTAENV